MNPRLLPLLLLGACKDPPAPCVPRRDVPVVDLTTDGDPELVSVVQEIVETFFGDTGRDVLCLEEVRVVDAAEGLEALTGHAGGVYSTVTFQLGIRDDEDRVAMTTTMRHELCHALDITEGLSGPIQDALLADVSEFVAETYPVEQQHLEVFARTCALGPRPPVDRLLEQTCPELRSGTFSQQFDERTTWPGAFPDAGALGLEVAWHTLSLGGRVDGLWRAGTSVLVLEWVGTGHQLRWIDDPAGRGAVVPLDVDLDDFVLWPGDRVLLTALEEGRDHLLIDRTGAVAPLSFPGLRGWDQGAVAGDDAAGTMLETASGGAFLYELDLTGDAEPVGGFGAPIARVESAPDELQFVPEGETVRARDADGEWVERHHAVTADGVDVLDGRLFHVDATDDDGATRPLLFLLADGGLRSSGCDAVEGMPARLGDDAVVVRAEGRRLFIGVVTDRSEAPGDR